MIQKILLSFFSLLLCYMPLLANPITTDQTTAVLQSDHATISPGQTFFVRVHLTLSDGWHSYWKNPGESGLKTTLDWTLPQGFRHSDILWLPPNRVLFGDIYNYGYLNNASHVVKLTAPHSLSIGEPFQVNVHAQWLTCHDVCIPEEGVLSLTLQTGDTPIKSVDYDAIYQDRIEVPTAILSEASYTQSVSDLTLEIPFEKPRSMNLDFFPDQNGLFSAKKPLFTYREGVLYVTLQRTGMALPDRVSGLLKFPLDMGIEQVIQVEASHRSFSYLGLLSLLFFSFLGGIILNIMPCVFPILSLKILSILKSDASQQQERRRQAYGYTLGILLSFIALALCLILLKSAGHAIGWGFQLQSPLFIAVLAHLMILVGLYLSGSFQIPGWALTGIGKLGSVKTTAPSTPSGSHSFMQSILTGCLATIIATPCTAPFMAPSIGLAFTLSPTVIIATFAMIGLGMAFPYLLLAFYPPLLAWVPKPGPWLETVKSFFAIPMYGTALWLAWVLVQQQGATGFLFLGIGVLFIALWIWSSQNLKQSYLKYSLLLIIISGLCWSYVQIHQVQLSSNSFQDVSLTADTQPFSLEAIQTLQTQKKGVFVDVTAAWCLSCQWNEKSVLHQPDIQDLFKEHQVTFMVADWTHRDGHITQFLSHHERQGVPLYVYYRSDGEVIRLPALLTKDMIRDLF